VLARGDAWSHRSGRGEHRRRWEGARSSHSRPLASLAGGLETERYLSYYARKALVIFMQARPNRYPSRLTVRRRAGSVMLLRGLIPCTARGGGWGCDNAWLALVYHSQKLCDRSANDTALLLASYLIGETHRRIALLTCTHALSDTWKHDNSWIIIGKYSQKLCNRSANDTTLLLASYLIGETHRRIALLTCTHAPSDTWKHDNSWIIIGKYSQKLCNRSANDTALLLASYLIGETHLQQLPQLPAPRRTNFQRRLRAR